MSRGTSLGSRTRARLPFLVTIAAVLGIAGALAVPQLLGAREKARVATVDNLYVALNSELANELDDSLNGGGNLSPGMPGEDEARDAALAARGRIGGTAPTPPAGRGYGVALDEGGFGTSRGWDREAYDAVAENPFLTTADHPLSTFAVDVDTASYANVRRILRENRLPPRGAVRIEEMLNHFRYDDDPPTDGSRFALYGEVGVAPWNPAHQLVRIALRGEAVEREDRPVSNLVFLVDVSGSMQPENKLPLVREGLARLTEQLDERDRIAIVVYAGAAGLVLPPTPGDEHRRIRRALENLSAGGSTNGGQGIELAYRLARESFAEGGTNRVVLATDGDFNVGVSNRSDLVELVRRHAREHVFLTVLGVGTGNLQDSQLEEIADRGNGTYHYLDDLREAQRVLVDELTSTLVTIAKDVKVQVELNPARVAAHRLLGYENRMLAARDFNDDRKDAGEVGAGHHVTALYEVVPAGGAIGTPAIDPLRYGPPTPTPTPAPRAEVADELLTVKVRWKEPEAERSRRMEAVLDDGASVPGAPSDDLHFAAAVAAFGMVLRGSEHRGDADLDLVASLAREATEGSTDPDRREFLELVERARGIEASQRRLARRFGAAGDDFDTYPHFVVAGVLANHRNERNPRNRAEPAYVARPPEELSVGQVGVLATGPDRITLFQYPSPGAPLRQFDVALD